MITGILLNVKKVLLQFYIFKMADKMAAKAQNMRYFWYLMRMKHDYNFNVQFFHGHGNSFCLDKGPTVL